MRQQGRRLTAEGVLDDLRRPLRARLSHDLLPLDPLPRARRHDLDISRREGPIHFPIRPAEEPRRLRDADVEPFV